MKKSQKLYNIKKLNYIFTGFKISFDFSLKHCFSLHGNNYCNRLHEKIVEIEVFLFIGSNLVNEKISKTFGILSLFLRRVYFHLS